MRKSYRIHGIERWYRVESVEDVDKLIAEMLAVPEAERGERFQEEVDILLDGRNLIELEERL